MTLYYIKSYKVDYVVYVVLYIKSSIQLLGYIDRGDSFEKFNLVILIRNRIRILEMTNYVFMQYFY